MNTINIFSFNEFLLEINSTNYVIDNSSCLEITQPQNTILAKVYPINQSRLSLPYCFKLYFKNNNLVCDNNFCNIYKLKDRYDIFIEPFLIGSNICLYTQSHTIKNIRYTVCCYEDRIKISCNKGEFVYEVCGKSFSSSTQNNHIFILCKNHTKQLVCFNCTNNTFYEIKGDQIEIEPNQIKSLQNTNDSLNHTIVRSYRVAENIELTTTDLYTKQSTLPQNPHIAIKVYSFFEAIKVGNQKFANTLVHKNLQPNILDNTLKNYFGDYEHIKLLSINPLVYTLYYSNTAKDYSITIKDQLIYDIDEI
ncbi:MAG: hypothetical protein J6Q51_00785 [Clostridia bacterium]|nr:hypothetical protein [Clostridia bacterium]